MSDDIIKRLREALAAGPTKGRWVAHLGGAGTVYSMDGTFRRGVCVHKSVCIAPTSRHDRTVSHVDMAFIAAASPDNIAALLDRLDKAERECERLRKDAWKWQALDNLMGNVAAEFECNAAAWPLIKHELSNAAIDAARAAEQPEGKE
jgi:hypothetical protein